MKKILGILGLLIFAYMPFLSHAETNDFVIMPYEEKDPTERINQVSNSGGHVWDEIDKQSYELGGSAKKDPDGLGQQLSSGIMNWNTLIDYLVYGLRFLSQIALIIGAVMFIWNGYEYAMYAFGGGDPKKDKIQKAIIGIAIVIFSYAIMRILTHAFLT